MINDLLDLTRIEQGRVQLELDGRARRRELVDEAVKRFQPQAQSGGLTRLCRASRRRPVR